MNTNRNFGKLQSNAIVYAPSSVRVVIHHHEEWDEPVIDPETGEPTGETKHMTNDWDEEKTILHPNAEDYLAAKDGPWKQIVIVVPPAREGFTWIPDGWEENDTTITRKWKEIEIEPPPKVYMVEEIIYQLIVRGKLEAVKEVLGGLYDLVTMRETVESDNEIIQEEFPKIKAALVSEGILTEDEIAAILKDAEV